MASTPPDQIAFSQPQQQGIVGHSIADEKIFALAQAYKITHKQIFDQNEQFLWKALCQFNERNGIHPTLEELKTHPGFHSEEKLIIDARLKALDRCLAMRSEIRLEAIAPAMKNWAIAQVFVTNMQESADIYARQDMALAVEKARGMLEEINRIDEAALESRIESAATRIDGEREQRIEDSKFRGTYGVSFLDEILHGIGRRELVLVGAYSGRGKTQFATMLASANVKQGKRVAYIALEADPKEIERRLKFPLLLKKYVAACRGKKMPYLDYGAWYKYDLDPEVDAILEPLEAEADTEFKSYYKNLTTVSRGHGDYALTQLERDVRHLAGKVDMIVVDHLHVIDLKDENENREMTAVMHRLGQLVRSLGVPIIACAHLKKPSGPSQLVPNQHDFHGSSNMVKVANTAIMLVPTSPGDFHISGKYADIRAFPTLIALPKSRTGGNMTGIVLFDPADGTYLKPYASGYVSKGGTHWEASHRIQPFQKSDLLEIVQVQKKKS